MDSHEQTGRNFFKKNQRQKLRRSWLWSIKLIKHISVVWIKSKNTHGKGEYDDFLELKKKHLGDLSQPLIHLLILQKPNSATLLRRSHGSTRLTTLLKKRQKTTKQAETKNTILKQVSRSQKSHYVSRF